jgi:transcription elongation GreA/GreB family factor
MEKPQVKINITDKETDFSEYVVCSPSTFMFVAYGYDAYIISELLEYKLLPNEKYRFKVGFPMASVDKVSNILSNHSINHIIVYKGEPLSFKKYGDNQYRKYNNAYNSITNDNYIFAETRFTDKSIVEQKNAKGIISVNSKVIFRDINGNEVITFTILGSYDIYKITKMGGAYYGGGYSKTKASEANFEENTISDESALAKALIGHKADDIVKFRQDDGETILYYIEEICNDGFVYKANEME